MTPLPRKFPCSGCGSEIVVRFLGTGEPAWCRSCGARTPVPPDAVVAREAPPVPPLPARPAPSGSRRPASSGDFPGLADAIGLLLLVLLSGLALALALHGLARITGRSDGERLWWMSVEASLALGVYWGWRRTGRPFREIYPFRAVPPVLLLPVLLSIAGLIPLELKILSLEFRIVPPPDGFVELLNRPYFRDSRLGFVVGVLSAPALEELLFRGLILRGLLLRYPPLPALLLCSALFAGTHVVPYLLAPILLVGMVLGWWAIASRSLVPSVAAHAMNNLWAGWVVLLVHGRPPWSSPDDFRIEASYPGPEWGVTLAGLVLVAGGVLWGRRILVGRAGNGDPAPAGEAAGGISGLG